MAGRAEGGGNVFALLWEAQACAEALLRFFWKGGRPGQGACRKGRGRKRPAYRMAAGCGMFRLAAFGRRPPCERVLRTRSRRPIPSRRCRAVVSREGMASAGERCTRHWRYFALAQAQRFLNVLSGLCLRKKAPPLHAVFVCGGITFSQRSGPRALSNARAARAAQVKCICGVKRASVQVPLPVPHVQSRRVFVARGKGVAQAEFMSAAGRVRGVQTLRPVRRARRSRAVVIPGRRGLSRRAFRVAPAKVRPPGRRTGNGGGQRFLRLCSRRE